MSHATALDTTNPANTLAAEGHPIGHDDLVTIALYITHTIRQLGDLVLDLDPPDAVPVTRLDLEPRVLFIGDERDPARRSHGVGHIRAATQTRPHFR